MKRLKQEEDYDHYKQKARAKIQKIIKLENELKEETNKQKKIKIQKEIKAIKLTLRHTMYDMLFNFD